MINQRLSAALKANLTFLLSAFKRTGFSPRERDGIVEHARIPLS